MNQYYYLDENSGKMATGWKQLSGKWYFLQDTGIMATGWLDQNGTKYFLNNDGSMVTGWHTEGDKKYFLTDSGAGGRMAAVRRYMVLLQPGRRYGARLDQSGWKLVLSEIRTERCRPDGWMTAAQSTT